MTWPDQRSHTKQQNLDTLQKAHTRAELANDGKIYIKFSINSLQAITDVKLLNCFMVKEKNCWNYDGLMILFDWGGIK